MNELNVDIGGVLSCREYVRRACKRLQEEKLLPSFKWQDLENEVLEAGNLDGKLRSEGPTVLDPDVVRLGG